MLHRASEHVISACLVLIAHMCLIELANTLTGSGGFVIGKQINFHHYCAIGNKYEQMNVFIV